jgi:hypothetical protein
MVPSPERGQIVKLLTESGLLTLNKRTPYAKWLSGRKEAGGWTGARTLRRAWTRAQMLQRTARQHIPWYELGRLMVLEQAQGRHPERES